jgi:hypothetical protein
MLVGVHPSLNQSTRSTTIGLSKYVQWYVVGRRRWKKNRHLSKKKMTRVGSLVFFVRCRQHKRKHEESRQPWYVGAVGEQVGGWMSELAPSVK